MRTVTKVIKEGQEARMTVKNDIALPLLLP